MWNCVCLGRQAVREDEVVSPKGTMEPPAIVEVTSSSPPPVTEEIVTGKGFIHTPQALAPDSGSRRSLMSKYT